MIISRLCTSHHAGGHTHTHTHTHMRAEYVFRDLCKIPMDFHFLRSRVCYRRPRNQHQWQQRQDHAWVPLMGSAHRNNRAHICSPFFFSSQIIISLSLSLSHSLCNFVVYSLALYSPHSLCTL
uniref:Uncharacterized protein n=1 Tax=Glypta fumiferanae TaxID=389681 RepID=A0A0F6QAB0_9HYME|nr:hypothetical protein [Glypta fumiferanae]